MNSWASLAFLLCRLLQRLAALIRHRQAAADAQHLPGDVVRAVAQKNITACAISIG